MDSNTVGLAIFFGALTVALVGIAALTDHHSTGRALNSFAALAGLMAFLMWVTTILTLAGVFG